MKRSISKIASHLAEIELWLVAFFVGLSMAFPRLLPLTIGVAGFFWLVRLLAYGRLSVRTPADFPIILLLLMTPITMTVTPLPQVTRLQILRLLSGVALYYAIVNWTQSLKRLQILVLGAALSALFLALAAPLSVEWSAVKLLYAPSAIYSRFVVLVSDTVHPNVLAGNLIILLPIPLAYLLFNWHEIGWLKRIAATFLNLVILSVIALTQSRGSWITFLVIILILLIMRWRWGWIGVVVVAIVSIIAIFMLGPNTLLQEIVDETNIGGINGRIEIWSRAVFMLQDFPYTGIGMGTFSDAIENLYPFNPPIIGVVSHAHNLFLQVGIDLGIPGLISWLSILLLTIFISWQIFQRGKKQKNSLTIGLGAGLLLSQVALIVHGLVEAVTWGMVRPAPVVWLLWGIAVAGWLVTTKAPIEFANLKPTGESNEIKK